MREREREELLTELVPAMEAQGHGAGAVKVVKVGGESIPNQLLAGYVAPLWLEVVRPSSESRSSQPS